MFQAFIYKKSCLRWFGHVQRSVTNAPVKKSELIQVEGAKKNKKNKNRGKPKFISKSIKKINTKDMSIPKVAKSMTFDRVGWRKRIHVANPNKSVEDS